MPLSEFSVFPLREQILLALLAGADALFLAGEYGVSRANIKRDGQFAAAVEKFGMQQEASRGDWNPLPLHAEILSQFVAIQP